MYCTKSIIAVFLLFLLVSCNSNNAKNEKIIYIKKRNIVKEKIQLSGLTCVGCEITIEEKLAKVEGVVTSKADYYKDIVMVEFDSTKTNLSSLVRLLYTTPYKPK